MRTITNDLEDVFLAGWSLMIGAVLVIAPWYFSFTSETSATWSAWASGAFVIVLAILAIIQAYDWLEYLVAIVGVWLCAAPWILGFADVNAAAWTHLGFGIALIISAAAELWRLYEGPGARSV